MPQKNSVQKKKEPTQPNKKKKQSKFNYLWLYVALVVALLLFMQNPGASKEKEEIASMKLERLIMNKDIDLVRYIQKDNIVEIFLKEKSLKTKSEFEKFREKNIKGPQYFITISDFNAFNSNVKDIQDKAVQIYLKANPDASETSVRNDYNFDIKQDTSKGWGLDIFWIILMILVLVFMLSSFRGLRGGGPGGIFNIGKSKAQLFDSKNNDNISFKDVAGLEGAKYEVEEIVDFLKNPKKYTELGGKIPKGALLIGPPGTGKTLLAKAVAGEAKVPFFSLSGSDFVEMFVGVGASRVRDLFQTAKTKAPCIIFIDEIDAIGRARQRNVMSGANDERENTLNQLLTEMDGFSTNTGVIILAATNRADILDRALMRAGRFDRQIHVELPNANERKGIFEVHVRNLKLSPEVDLEYFAKQTPGFSGADIANVCNESALIAARHGKKHIEKEDMLAAIDRIIGGLERRGSMISPEEKRVIAYHESGHAAVGWLLEHASPLVKVTIVPRGKSLGAAWYLPEERHITTTEQMLDELTATLGGRAAEEVAFGKISTGALSDLEKVTKQAYAMVVYYGLNETIGNISFYDSTGQQEYALTKPYSEKTAQQIDEEISKLIESAYKRAKNILMENKEKLTQLAEILIEKEVIFAEDLEAIFGKRKYEPEKLA
ncbi:MAG: ATP-dependent zinc metalloprotease FtsH [Bacteroidetes bacterium]|nr:ATP-dependent zinc metalloprotease FtsH [Bacteroidota bacterium]MCL1968748.1 ATP-dependent zinc metalloprotease FtsH [Bacteroidota bacterium]